jgi:GTP pyrophosphokinase
MMGAKINGVIVPIDKVPQNGDIIEIITSQSSKGPSRDWLKIVKTGAARSKIRQWFKKEKRSENILVGRAEVEKEVRKIGKGFTDAQINDVVTSLAKRVGIQDADDFYNTIGFGGLSLSRFLPKLRDELEKILAEEQKVAPKTAEEEASMVKLSSGNNKTRSSGGIIIDGEHGCQVKFAKCCNPLPGDKIVGFVTRGFGVSVHKSDCPNVFASRKNEENLSRWVNAQWDIPDNATGQSANTYEATVQLILEDGIGIIAGVSVALADMKVSITSINTQMQKNGTMLVNLTVECKNTSHYESIVSKLRSLPAVISVSRGFYN